MRSATRRLGELSAQLEKVAPEEKGQMAHGVLPSSGKNSKAATLKAAGISTSQAHRLNLRQSTNQGTRQGMPL